MRQGRTWVFLKRPGIIAHVAVGGPKEKEGPLAKDFHKFYDDVYLGKKSYEEAERQLLIDAMELAIRQAKLAREDIDVFLSGDLLAQNITASFAARSFGQPFLGLHGACSVSMEGLSLAASLVDSGYALRVMTGTASHNLAAERTYRYPTEYGAQKPPTAQWTVTGAGVGIVSLEPTPLVIRAATVGRVIDLGLRDPLNMGAAMAPAAFETIMTHLKDLGRTPNDYDLIVTGDLGRIGLNLLIEMLQQESIPFEEERLLDAGLMIYHSEQEVFSGASGTASSATVFYGHLLNQMEKGHIDRLMMVATGALMSPTTYQQGESIPTIAHAVTVERVKEA